MVPPNEAAVISTMNDLVDDNRMTVIDANAQPSQEAVEAMARLLIDVAERGKEEASDTHQDLT